MNPDPDLNELDKAVDSLANNTSKTSQPNSGAQSSGSDDSSSPLKPHAKKGRFMDVVHPSADMTSTSAPSASEPDGITTSYVGKTITPASKDVKPDPVPEKNVDDLPVVKQLSPIEDADPSSLVATPDIAEIKKPDPLEEAAKKERERVARDGAKQRKEEREADSKKPSAEDKGKPEASDESSKTKDESSKNKAEEKPLFLEGAKVEKRPLGAFNDDTKSSAEENNRPALTLNGKEKDDAQKVTTPPPPPEFNKEVVALEASDESSLESDESPKLPEHKKEKDLKKKEVEKLSLPPQYKQAIKQKSGDAQSSIYEPAVFDAFADSNTPSSTKPWMWAIIFLGIIALGVALALGTFFVVGD